MNYAVYAQQVAGAGDITMNLLDDGSGSWGGSFTVNAIKATDYAEIEEDTAPAVPSNGARICVDDVAGDKRLRAVFANGICQTLADEIDKLNTPKAGVS